MAKTRPLLSWPLLLGLVWGLQAGCGPSPVLRTARSGDLAAYRDQLAKWPSDERLSQGEAQDIAQALLAKQITTAQGDDGTELLEAVAPCAAHFPDALAERAKQADELAGRAALLRVDNGLAKPMSTIAKLGDPLASWRAAGARSLNVEVAGRDGREERHALDRAAQWRQKMMSDPAEIVRLAALRAAADAADPADIPALLAAGRGEPSELARLAAIAALGAIGTNEAIMGLKDLWEQSASAQRTAIVQAWALAYGQRQRDTSTRPCEPGDHSTRCRAYSSLVGATETICDDAALRAAIALQRDDQARSAAVLERCLIDGAQRQRLAAIDALEVRQPLATEALRRAAADDDTAVAAAALARLSELGGDEGQEALQRLATLAAASEQNASAALPALVRVGSPAAVPLLARQAASQEAAERRRAGEDLAQMRQMRRALQLLGDDDPSVRAATGCAILSLPR